MKSIQSKTGVLRKKYTTQFKEQALVLADKVGVPKAAQDLAIADAMLYSWRAKRRQTGQSFEDQKLKCRGLNATTLAWKRKSLS